MKLRQVVHVAWTLPYILVCLIFLYTVVMQQSKKGRFPFSFHSGFWHSVCKGDHEKFNFNEINNSDIIIA